MFKGLILKLPSSVIKLLWWNAKLWMECIKMYQNQIFDFSRCKKKLTIQNRDDGIGSNSAFFRVYGFFCRT